MPSASYARGEPLRPIPKSKRPSLNWSTVATSSAIRSGLLSGRTWIAVPTRTRRVRAAMKLASAIGDESTERDGLKWISPSHTPSRPQASDASTRSNVSRNHSASPLPRRASSMKIPKSMGLGALEPHVLVGRPDGHGHQVDRVVGEARSDPHQRAEVHDGREHHAIDGELLDAMQQGLALGLIAFPGLLQEQLVDIGISAVRVAPLLVDELLDAGRRVARVSHGGDEQPAQLLLPPRGVEHGALDRPHL